MLKRTFADRRALLSLAAALAVNVAVYYTGRFLSAGMVHRCLETGADRAIPILPWTVLFYWGGFLFWIVNYALSIHLEQGGRGRFLTAHILGELVCFLFFVLLPTTMTRPEVTGRGPGAMLLRLTFLLDDPDNLFPSIHCFASWLCWIGVRREKGVPPWYRALSLVLALAVCVSTLTVKQHVIADSVSGVLLAELSYLAAGLAPRLRNRASSGEREKARSEEKVG